MLPHAHAWTRRATAGVIGLLLTAAQAAPLPNLNINRSETSVSGLSSGGYMAVQFHVANSSFVKGAGVIAGGPYYCASDDQQTALTICSCVGTPCHPEQALQRVPNYVAATNQNASRADIDPISNMLASKVWLFSGSADSVVPKEPVAALRDYYTNFLAGANIAVEAGVPAEHAMPTDSFGNTCSARAEPFINNCQYDAAGKLLAWIYGALNPRNEGALSGNLIEFDQAEFLADPAAHGMFPTGWAYVPQSCRQQAGCRVHIAFHGCKQFPNWPYAAGPNGRMGDTFARHAGYNQWADTNNIVVLYPQANSMTIGTRTPRSNPTGCWDWWGYDDANYAVRGGRQVSAVQRMVNRLAGLDNPIIAPVGYCGTASNSAHVVAGRAQTLFFWWYYANGTGDYLGMGANGQSTLQEVSQGTYRVVHTCP